MLRNSFWLPLWRNLKLMSIHLADRTNVAQFCVGKRALAYQVLLTQL